MNIKPWTLLIQRLEGQPKEAAEEIPCRIKLEQLHVVADRCAYLELSVEPSRYDWPETLSIEIGGEGSSAVLVHHDLVTDGDLARTRVVHLEVPLQRDDGGVVILPYRATGQSIRSLPIDIKGKWTCDRRALAFQPLAIREMTALWPGATGDPQTTRTRAFYGRQEEKQKIARLLDGNDGRQRSLMLIGQRRIGKTSLLLEMLHSYPPRGGGVCGIYCDVATLRIKEEPLPKQLFDRIVSYIESDPGGRNEPVRATIHNILGMDVSLHRLTKSIDAGTSLAVALHQFVSLLNDRIGISRIAVFLDEFHHVMSRSQDEVEQLMRDLRPLVQQSSQVSLVFAGSGLTRRLVNAYDAAMFGSIDTIELGPFNWPDDKTRVAGERDDREAIQDLFMPPAVRDRLCARDEFQLLTRRSYELSGGHPYYLSMLGYAAGSYYGGRPLTRVMLDHVADEMVAGHVNCDAEISAKKFYGHLLQSLDVMDKRTKAIVQAVLAHMAAQVTLEYPWVFAERAVDVPSLLRVTTESERVDALVRLREDGIIVKDPQSKMPRYRIRIPLVAAALRHDAAELEEQAMGLLRCARGERT